MRYLYMNNTTGEIYPNLWCAIRTIINDMIRNPRCRTIKMFNLKRGDF